MKRLVHNYDLQSESELRFATSLLKLPYGVFHLQPEIKLSLSQMQDLESGLSRLRQGEPAEYVLGTVDFFDCEIRVTRDALIPRPETEILAVQVAELLADSKPGEILLDLCSGTGCLGISLKKHLPHLDVYLSDISPNCVELAKENVKLNEVDVNCLLGDLLTTIRGKQLNYLVCNPPYISTTSYLNLSPSVRNHEPPEALLAGPKGIDYYARLALELPEVLAPGAKVFLEIGFDQGELVDAIFSSPVWTNQRCLQDWAGHDRFFFFEKRGED
ncbi:MAG: Release factor glutamine methyltransferase [Chlamydiia bacterium]|nr:Release factor glutamine methyltransferase [Chlamydiia bacterium]